MTDLFFPYLLHCLTGLVWVSSELIVIGLPFVLWVPKSSYVYMVDCGAVLNFGEYRDEGTGVDEIGRTRLEFLFLFFYGISHIKHAFGEHGTLGAMTEQLVAVKSMLFCII